MSILLSMLSTRVLLNVIPGDNICHDRGIRYGDPLSPMLFLLIMKVQSALIRKADE
jgi:hypothetical protein